MHVGKLYLVLLLFISRSVGVGKVTAWGGRSEFFSEQSQKFKVATGRPRSQFRNSNSRLAEGSFPALCQARRAALIGCSGLTVVQLTPLEKGITVSTAPVVSSSVSIRAANLASRTLTTS